MPGSGKTTPPHLQPLNSPFNRSPKLPPLAPPHSAIAFTGGGVRKVLNADDSESTPSHILEDGKDYVPTKKMG